jgi:copper chaperone CopZ
MKSILFLSLALLILISCSGEKQTEKASKEISADKVVADASLELSIEGMVCEHGCGGSIRKALKETGAVERVSFDFEDERASNTATVKYDSKKTSKKKLMAIISELNEGQFSVKEISSSKESGNTKESGNSDADEKASISSYDGSFQIPNIFELLSGLIL